MTPEPTEAAGPGDATGPVRGRPSARFWAALGVVTVVVVVGSWGAAHRGGGPPGWAGQRRFAPDLGATRDLDAAGLLLALVPVASLLLARRPGRAGVVGCAAVVGALAAYLLLGYPFGPVLLPGVVAVVLTAAAGRRVLAWATAAALAATTVGALALRDALDQPLLLTVVPWFVVLLLVGEALRVRQERRATAEAAQAARLQSLVATERLGIARELHDVLAHSLSAINVQAGVGLHLMDDDPDQARASLQAVKDTSRQALEEVRVVIGALRRDGDASRSPTPGLDDVAALLDEAAATGLRVRADVVVDDAPVPQRVGTAVYRIVQESLTNVRRHAARPEASVGVVVGAATVVVTVRSPLDPARSPGDEPVRAGHGLVGMRERAEALGGRVSAGPQGGDFVVRAELPRDGTR